MVPNAEFWVKIVLFVVFGLIGVHTFSQLGQKKSGRYYRIEAITFCIAVLIVLAKVGMYLIGYQPPEEFSYALVAAFGNIVPIVGLAAMGYYGEEKSDQV